MTIKKEATVSEAVSRWESGAIWIDVREPVEWAASHIAGTQHIPLALSLDAIEQRYPDRSTALNISCAVGGRSARVVAALEDRGYSDVANVAGGIRAWVEEGRPVVSASGLTDEQNE